VISALAYAFLRTQSRPYSSSTIPSLLSEHPTFARSANPEGAMSHPVKHEPEEAGAIARSANRREQGPFQAPESGPNKKGLQPRAFPLSFANAAPCERGRRQWRPLFLGDMSDTPPENHSKPHWDSFRGQSNTAKILVQKAEVASSLILYSLELPWDLIRNRGGSILGTTEIHRRELCDLETAPKAASPCAPDSSSPASPPAKTSPPSPPPHP
jgi:hypothetical protein